MECPKLWNLVISSSSKRSEIILLTLLLKFYWIVLHLVNTLVDWLTVLRDTFCLNAVPELLSNSQHQKLPC